jgi:hypothetical protein
MARVERIYARLFTHIDVATSLLLKQDLVDAESENKNQRIFTEFIFSRSKSAPWTKVSPGRRHPRTGAG